MIRKVKFLFLRIFEIIFNLLPYKKNAVLFKSFNGQYNDNPKYISIELHKIYPTIKQYWVIGKRCHEKGDLPKYIKIIKIGSLKETFIKSRCKVIVDNGAGWHMITTKKFKKIYTLLKKREQFNISTWHGTPLKKIGADSYENIDWKKEDYFTTSSCLICGSKYIKEIFQQCFYSSCPLFLTGTPRNDLFVRPFEIQKKNAFKNKLKLPNNKKIVLFAPTYRNNVEDSGVAQMRLIRPNVLLDCFSKKFGGDWVLVFRSHNMVLDSLKKEGFIDGINVLDGNCFDDMAEYLYCCDAVITDYSGVLFDICLTKLPCFLFAHDSDHYAKSERGLYLSLDKLPFAFNKDFESLLECILNYDENEQNNSKFKFLEFLGNCEDGLASQKCCQIIMEKL